MDRDNTAIGKYKIVAQVGEGAMGVVYRAVDPVLNRTVAIKVMSEAIARDDDLRTRFLREAQAAGSLQHPNVITIYDCGEIDGHLFIAMEFVEGADLEDLLRKTIALSLADKIDIVIDVLGGLFYAHKRGIVHRDIKPANIRIDEEGRARIMDFGIAHLSSSNMTRTGVMVGTPAYMAPEQIVGGPISAATDIFSVGSVLYELLSGVRPFAADTLQGVMYQIVSQPATDLSLLTGTPPALNDVVQRALAKEPAERFETALDMANALTEVRSNLARSNTATMKTVSLRSVIDTALADARSHKSTPPRSLPRAFPSGLSSGPTAGTRPAAVTAPIPKTMVGTAPDAAVTGAPASNTGRRNAIIGATVAAAAAAAVVLMFTRNKSTPPPAQTSAAVAPATTAAPPAAPAAAPPAATPTAPAPDPAPQTTPKVAPAPASKATKSGAASSAPAAPSAQELALLRSLRTTALDGRKRAADAGAPTDQLAAGDDHVKAADAAAQQGKVSDAADHLNQATAAWATAERDARATAAANAARQRVSVADPPRQAPVPAPIVTPPVAAPAALPPTAPTTANATADIRAAAAAYAHAIESRDIAEVRRAYPDITQTQARGFEQFFGSVRQLHANFTVSGLEVNGATADAKLVGEYDYVTNGGKAEKQPVSFQASFRRDGAVWKLASVR